MLKGVRSKHVLFLLAAVSVLGTFSGSSEPVIPFLRGTSIEPLLYAFHNGNAIGLNLSIGYLVSLMFWYLIVYLPEKNVRRILRSNLAAQYQNFKVSAIQQLLWASVGIHDSNLPTELSRLEEFNKFFNGENKQRWYDVLNHLQEHPEKLSDLLFELQQLSEEVGYVLTKVNFDNADLHAFLRRLSGHAYRLRGLSVYSYDQVNYVAQSFWEILTGWSFIDGYRKEDIIQKMIEKI